jgi:beta-glucosidase
MKNRTYRYFTGKPLFAFGYGLSYTTFRFSDLKVPATVTAGEAAPIDVTVTNTGSAAGDEVAELYLTQPRGYETPIHVLAGFVRIHLAAGESGVAHFNLSPRSIGQIDEQGNRVILPGAYTVSVGGAQPGDFAGEQTGQFTVAGRKELPK